MSVRIFKPYEDEKPPALFNDPGSIMEPQYKERYDDRGVAYLEKVGEVNTYEKIQSYRDECDVMSILSRYAAGDQTVLATPGWYIDTSKMPSSYTEFMNLMNEQREKFESLPLNIRAEFGMSFEKWAATAGDESWMKAMGFEKQQNKQTTKTDPTDTDKQKEEKNEQKQ